jgi:hypothetical protein
VTVNGDTTVEGDETFTVNLSNATGATIADGSGLGTITNDDATPPSISIEDVALAEGNSGITAFTFMVTLSSASTSAVTVDYRTNGGTATAASDYTAIPTTNLSFLAGETTKFVTVNASGDTTVEPNETFAVELSNPSGAILGDGHGAGTILNDDTTAGTPPSIFINDVRHAEGNRGTTAYTFSVTLSRASTSRITVQLKTNDKTAVSPSDFRAIALRTLVFAPGQTRKQVTVQGGRDRVYEQTELFTVRLKNATNARIGDPFGVGTIVNDDSRPSFSINDASVPDEPGTMTFTVTRSGPTARPSRVSYATRDGTATAGNSYISETGTLSFAVGETRKTITISIIDDTRAPAAPDTFFWVDLSAPIEATIADGTGRGALRDDPGRTRHL